LLVADLHQRGGDVVDVLDVHPPGHIGHAPPGAGGGEQQHRQQLGPEQLPVVGVLGLVAVDVGGVGEHAADPPCVGVGVAGGERRPAGARDAAEAEGVVDPTIFHAAQISFPMRVRILEPGLKYGALRGMPVVPRLEDVVVNNGEHDIVELVNRLNAWTRARSTGQLGE
jgi:hypothetical protein